MLFGLFYSPASIIIIIFYANPLFYANPSLICQSLARPGAAWFSHFSG